MRIVRHALVLGLVALAIAAANTSPVAQTSSGEPKVVQTDCDTLSLNPPLVRVEFGVINLGTTPICSFRLTPVDVAGSDADSCRILECSNAPGWSCSVDAADGSATWTVLSGADCIGEGEKHEPFDILLDPLFCCYRAEFFDASGNLIHEDVVCFECEKPVPTQTSTWGRVKTLYR